VIATPSRLFVATDDGDLSGAAGPSFRPLDGALAGRTSALAWRPAGAAGRSAIVAATPRRAAAASDAAAYAAGALREPLAVQGGAARASRRGARARAAARIAAARAVDPTSSG
jgi:hypothetical protein